MGFVGLRENGDAKQNPGEVQYLTKLIHEHTYGTSWGLPEMPEGRRTDFQGLKQKRPV
jgi:hypothetical protein